MSRPLRIEYPGAWYHVMNRGRRGEKIFLDRKDYLTFLDLLKESSDTWHIHIAGYCLMPNHYHLLVHTPKANLSRSMRHINGVYTQRFNRRHGIDGQLFRGRYKSILVDADSYILQLLRYIHRNPARAGLVKESDNYEWSSHRGYISNGKKWDWLYKDFALSMLASVKSLRRRFYRQFMAEADSEEILQVFTGKKWPSVLASKEFIDSLKERFFSKKRHQEIPESTILSPDKERIKQSVCDFYGVKEEILCKSKRGVVNEPRNVAIYLARILRNDSLGEICRDYGLKKYSSAGSAIERVNGQRSRDKKFKGRIDKIISMTIKSHTET